MRTSHLTLLAFCQLAVAAFVLYSALLAPVESQPIDHQLQARAGPQTSPKYEEKKSQISPAFGAKSVVEPSGQIKPSVGQFVIEQPIKSFKSDQVQVSPGQEDLSPRSSQLSTSSSSRIQVQSELEQAQKSPDVPSSKSVPTPVEKVAKQQVAKQTVEVSPLEARVVRTGPVPNFEVYQAVVPNVPARADNVAGSNVVPAVPVRQEGPAVRVQQPPVALVVVEPRATKGQENVEPAAASKVEPKSSVEVAMEKVKPEKKAEDSPITGRAEVEVSRQAPGEALVATVSVVEPKGQAVKESIVKVVHAAPAAPTKQQVEPLEAKVVTPVVMGGLGPLYLLASTLCNQTLKQPSADERLSQLYNKRAQLRQSLFEYMSLKFTHLEKLSSKLNGGRIEIVPVKAASGTSPSAGWPVVGSCTAHDLKLMAEAAWCDQTPVGSSRSKTGVISRKRRATDPAQIMQDDGISKILQMSDTNKPALESTIASLNLNPEQIITFRSSIDDYKCRRSALRMTKTLFEHLAEDQGNVSGTWPELFGAMSQDECARKRMIDVVNALAGFRGEASSIRRDNLEYAFAVDDLRAKVLDYDLNKPLTFDRQFIEVGQFLQQSVRLMLSNIEPDSPRARLTSMRYRSLMDDQCIELHQRLLNKNDPATCNPIEFGQLPDVLRMTANSLELWSIERDIVNYGGNSAEIASAASALEVSECIANLVAK